MKLSNRIYAIERAFKPFLIPFKIAGQMNTAVWEGIVNDAEMIIRAGQGNKTKPQAKRLQKLAGNYNPVRKKVNYKADESLIHERYNLEEVRKSRKWNNI